MAQHFLLSSKARSLSLAQVMRLSDDEAYETFKALRWADTDGAPVCPRCGGLDAYAYKARRIFKCRECGAQFSITTGTIFASRKLAHRDLLAAVAIFVNGAKGVSALQLSRDLGVQYKSAYVLAHKLREVMAAEVNGHTLNGKVEIDGAYFGGYVKPENIKAERKDLRLSENRSGKRQSVVVLRERKGRAVTGVFEAEYDSPPFIRSKVQSGTVIYADEGQGWDRLHAAYDMRRVNHSVAFMDQGVCTNQAESFFSRLRRAEIGTHHKIAGPYLSAYANEMAWRENNRRICNGGAYKKVLSGALNHPVSRQWRGYWQRSTA